MSTKRKPIVFATSSYGYLADQILASKQFISGKIARGLDKAGAPIEDEVPFPDGERYTKLLTDVEDREVILVGGTISDAETLELFDLANVIVGEGALKLRIVIPYFGYSTMERGKAGEAIKAKYRARLLSAIPRAQQGNRFYFLDLHAEGTEHYFEGDTNTRHMYGKGFVVRAAQKMVKDWMKANRGAANGVVVGSQQEFDEGFVLASTDAGRAKWVESLARDMSGKGMHVNPAFIIKRRVTGSDTEVRDISADVDGKLVIIYDDMIRTGGSLLKAAKAYLEKGAAAVLVIATHGVLPGVSLTKLRDSKLIQKIVVTNSHHNAVTLEDGEFLVTESVSELIVTYLTKGARYAQERYL